MRNLIGISILMAGMPFGPALLAQGHMDDVGLSVLAPGGRIVTAGGDWQGTYAGRVFEGVFDGSGLATSPGFDAPAATFRAGAQLRFDFAKQLLYWNGSALATPAATMTLDYQGSSATITGGAVTGGPGFLFPAVPIDGSFHPHLNYGISSGAATGLYGVVLTLGPGEGSTGFSTSEPFLVTFLQDSLSTSSYNDGMQALVGAAFVPVPEPSGLLLSSAAALAGGLAVRRMARNRRR